MRIGIDCRLWNQSGVGRYIRNLVLELAKIDKRNQYILFFQAREFTHLELPGKNFEKKLSDVRWHTLAEQIKFPTILNKEKLDLVHFPYFSVPIFYKKPHVVTIHDLILDHFPTGEASTLSFPLYQLKLLGYKFIIAYAIKNAKKIITVSKTTKKEIVDHFGINEDRIAVAYEGVDKGIMNHQSRIMNKKKPYFLYVGNAYPHKNLNRLLDALNILISSPRGEAGQYPNISLVMVGKEDFFYKKLRQKAHKMNLQEQVIFKGNITDEELSGLYKSALALVMPSLMEGFGLPIIEAMANNCLVLASDIPVHKEIAGSASLYFDPYNVTQLAEKMNNICSNDSNHPPAGPLRREASKAGRSKIIEQGLERIKMFSWEKMGKETLKVYESSIGLRPSE